MKKHIISFILTFILLVTMTSLCTFAAGTDFVTAEYTYADADGNQTAGLEIVGYSGSDTDIYIPSTIGEVPVLKIGDNFLKDNTSVNSVTLGAGIKEIGAGAFSGAANMVCALLNEDIEVIGAGAFSNMPVFNSIILWDSVTNIGVGAFLNCPGLVIYCIENNKGHVYAIANNISYELLGTAEAQRVVSDGIVYSIFNGEATIVDCIYDDRSTYQKYDCVVPSHINGYPVTVVGSAAFADCQFKSLTLPVGLQTITPGAFANFNAGKIVIPEGITEILAETFDSSGYGTLILPSSLITVGNNAFQNSSFHTIEFKEGLKTIGNYAFKGMKQWGSKLILPSTLESIGDYAFDNTWSLKPYFLCPDVEFGNYVFTTGNTGTWFVYEIWVPYGLKNAGNIFRSLYDIKNVHIKDVAAWCENYFDISTSYNPQLKLYIETDEGDVEANHLIIPEGVTIIGDAFIEFANIQRVEFPSTLTAIEKDYFPQSTITDISFYPSSVTSIPAKSIQSAVETVRIDSFDGYFLNGKKYAQNPVRVASNLYVGGEKINTLTIPEDITAVSSGLFNGMSSTQPNLWLEELYIGENVTSIGASAFANCTNLKNIYIDVSENGISFGSGAFSGCTSIENVYINDFDAFFELSTFGGTYANPLSFAKNVYVNGEKIESITIDNDTDTVESYKYNGTWLKEIVLHNGITTISSFAFFGCVNLLEIDIPDSVISIGTSAFKNCSSLTSVNLPSKLTVIESSLFSGCSALVEIGIPDTIVEIKTLAFENCSSLLEFVIPSGVTVINSKLFYGCSSLSSVTFHENITSICEYAFAECGSLFEIEIPSLVNTLEKYTFYNCSQLVRVVLPSNLSYIREYVFYGCVALSDINIEDTLVTTIDDYCFYNCSSLVSFDFTSKKYTLDEYCFAYSGIKEVYTSDKAIIINGYAFKGSVVENVNVPKAYNISWGVFQDCLNLKNVIINASNNFYSDIFSGCTSLESVVLGGSIKTIPTKTFYNCSSLESIEIPENVTSIGQSAFYGCSNLKYISMPSTITSLPDQTFYGCTSLTSIIVPEGCTSIGYYTFYNCSSLSEIRLPQSITSLSSAAFKNCGRFIAYVVENSYVHSTLVNNKVDCDFVFVSSITDDCITYEIAVDSNGNQYAIVVSCLNTAVGDIEIKSEIDGVPVTEIADNAFRNCTTVTNISVPDSVITIGDYAFYKAKSVNLTSSVKNIGDYAFYYSGLTNTEIDMTGFENVGSFAFSRCENITSVIYSKELVSAGENIFSSCNFIISVTIGDSVTIIPEGFLNGCVRLAEVIIPDGVNTIGADAFCRCYNLTEVIIPDSVNTIGAAAFEECTALKNVKLSNSLTEISNRLFYECSKLTGIEIPASVTKIGEYAFCNCIGLNKSGLTENVVYLANGAYYGCSNITDFSKYIPNFTYIGNYALYKIRCGTVTLSKNLTYVGKNGITKSPDYIFMSKITIPKEIESGLNADSFGRSALVIVFENSYAHSCAIEYEWPNTVIRTTTNTVNPEIAYGTSISGMVTYTDGTSASGVTVELLYDDGVIKETTTTDSNGEYSFTYAEVGRYTIRVNDGINTASEQVSVKRKNVFDVILTGETELVLKKGYTVSGNVSGEGSITVTITDKDGNVIDSVVAENGSFEFENIPNGEYIIKTENADGSVTVEVTVFGGDVALENITIEKAQVYVTLSGQVVVEDRESEEHAREWAQVTVYNSDGIVVATAKTDENGNYRFEKLPVGEYTIKAEVTEMREDEYYGYIRPHVLKGYAYADALEAGEYEVETIVLTEEESQRVSVSGKVTAQGEHQECEVILMNENRDEIARFKTKKNGKYQFDNVRDGYYILCAVTEHDGAGFAEITVKNGVVYGETDIRVYKSDRVSAHEAIMLSVPDCETTEQAEQYRETVMSEKTFYDSIPDKEKKMFSEWYIAKLDKLVQLLSGYEFTCDGAEVTNGGLIVSEEEVSSGANPHFTIMVVETDKWEKNKNGIETDEDYYQTFVEEAAGDNELAQYYDITLECEKNGKTYEIKDVKKHTDTTGKIRLTMPIPDKFKGHKNYAFVHVHNGVPTTLVDLDDDPDTITFEIDRFSTFALMFNDEEQVDLSDYATLEVADGVLTATSTVDATLFVATYEESGRMSDVKLTTLYADTPVEINVEAGQKAFVLDSTMSPLCEELIVG